jgi:dihydroorotase
MTSQESPSWKAIQEIELPATADMHVHLRDGPMMQAVTPTIRAGGVNTVFVMVSFMA